MPYSNLALDADRENGPAARSFAADAHDRIMVRINDPTEYKSAARRYALNGELPSGHSTDRQIATDQTRSHAKSPSPRSSSLRVLRPQGAAKHKRR